MFEFEDYIVPPMKNEAIQKKAEAIYRLLNPSDNPAPDVLDVLVRARSLPITEDLDIITKPDAHFNGAYAYSSSSPNRIFVRENVLQAARKKVPRARHTLIHELGHIILGHSVSLPRMAVGNKKRNIEPYRSAEHQADWFAATFLMPEWRVESVKSAEELSDLCGTSQESATIRLKQHNKQKRPQEPYAEVIQFIAENKSRLRSAPVDDRAVREKEVQERLDKAWELLPVAQNLNPALFRETFKGVLIERSQYMKPRSPHGWLEYQGKLCSYAELNS